MHAGIVDPGELPAEVADGLRPLPAGAAGHLRPGRRPHDRRARRGRACRPAEAGALAALRAFNYERIYVRPASVAQSAAVVEVLRALVHFYGERPEAAAEPGGDWSPARRPQSGPR